MADTNGVVSVIAIRLPLLGERWINVPLKIL